MASFTSPVQGTKTSATGTDETTSVQPEQNEEIKKLRFSHHRTAFDVDIATLDTHAWRAKNADISDYFNYGFNEKTWQVYNI